MCLFIITEGKVAYVSVALIHLERLFPLPLAQLHFGGCCPFLAEHFSLKTWHWADWLFNYMLEGLLQALLRHRGVLLGEDCVLDASWQLSLDVLSPTVGNVPRSNKLLHDLLYESEWCRKAALRSLFHRLNWCLRLFFRHFILLTRTSTLDRLHLLKAAVVREHALIVVLRAFGVNGRKTPAESLVTLHLLRIVEGHSVSLKNRVLRLLRTLHDVSDLGV